MASRPQAEREMRAVGPRRSIWESNIYLEQEEQQRIRCRPALSSSGPAPSTGRRACRGAPSLQLCPRCGMDLIELLQKERCLRA